MKSIIDFIPAEKYDRFNELLTMAAEAKKNAPKTPRAPRGPMTNEQKLKMAEARKAKYEKMVADMLAAQNG